VTPTQLRAYSAVVRHGSVKAAAAELGVTEAAVRGYSRSNRIPFDLTPGRQRLYSLEEVKAALDLENAPLRVSPIGTTGIGAGASFQRSAMASMDAERRAIVGESIEGDSVPITETESAFVGLISRSRRVLVAV